MQKIFLNNLINKNISFFSINFTKFLTKKEKSILLILKKEFKNRYIEIEKNLLLKNGIYSDMEELEINIFNDLYKLREKNIIISYKGKPMTFIGIISSFHIDRDIIGVMLSEEFASSFNNNSFFNDIKLDCILNFREKYTHILYQKFIFEKKESISFELEEFKNLFNLTNKNYTRFYDLEKNMLIPMIKDITENSNLKVEYEKIRVSEYKNSKILGIKFRCKNIIAENKNLNLLINSIKNKVQNIDYIYNLMNNLLPVEGSEYLKERIDYALQLNPKNFEDFLIKILFKREYKNEIILYKENRKFSSPFEIHSFFLKLIKELNSKNININFEVFSIKFLTKIYFLKEGKEIYYNEKNYSFYLEYKLHEKSTIIIKKYILEN